MTNQAKAHTERTLFSRTTSVTIEIMAAKEKIFDLLTNAAHYPTWNSTIISIEGKIAKGDKIRLTATMAPKRVFKLTIFECTPSDKIIWGDAMGKRTFTLTRMPSDAVQFNMTEKIGGPLFPLFAGMIPPFDAAFEQFAIDLKTISEK